MHVNRRALFLVYQRTVFVDAYRVASRLKALGSYEPAFLVARGTAALVQMEIDRCKGGGIACVTEEELLATASITFAQTAATIVDSVFQYCRRVRRRLIDGLLRRLPTSIAEAAAKQLATRSEQMGGRLPHRFEEWLGIASDMDMLGSVEARHHRALMALRPDVVCLSEDIPGPTTAPLIKVARQLGIPTVIIPFTIPNPRETLEACFTSVKDRSSGPSGLVDRLLIHMYPRWVATYKNRLLLRLPGSLAIACEHQGIAPPDPWTANSGYADRIAVESEWMLHVYRKVGFSEKQLSLTGSCADDLLYAASRDKAARRAAICRELNLSADRGILLSSLVPDQLTGGALPDCEFSSYAELVKFWIRALTRVDAMNVVLKINPRYRYEEFLYLEQLGVKIAPHDTIDLLPLADIYVTSVSSTLRWAIACGIPSINYDVYRYRYGDYLDAPGVVHVETKEDFAAAVTALAGDATYYGEIRQRQLNAAKSWGCLDGQSTERLVALFDVLCSSAAGTDTMAQTPKRQSQSVSPKQGGEAA